MDERSTTAPDPFSSHSRLKVALALTTIGLLTCMVSTVYLLA